MFALWSMFDDWSFGDRNSLRWGLNIQANEIGSQAATAKS